MSEQKRQITLYERISTAEYNVHQLQQLVQRLMQHRKGQDDRLSALELAKFAISEKLSKRLDRVESLLYWLAFLLVAELGAIVFLGVRT